MGRFFAYILFVFLFPTTWNCQYLSKMNDLSEMSQLHEMQAFSHPLSLDTILVYVDSTGERISLASDLESGWRLKVIKASEEEFYVEFLEGPLQDESVWIEKKDVGVVIENYNNFLIGAYEEPSESSKKIMTINESMVVVLVGFDEFFVQVCLEIEAEMKKVWIQRKFICDNPVTTCN